ncbi:MAG: Mrp/NBP35 family ATP-binding protein [Candidatus Cloacimonadota bacterium]|nr:Mrp/NBP35 family ATP-binding protein [Candidatus Cloacimonadota bacterium]
MNNNDNKSKSKYLKENLAGIKHKLIVLSGKGGVGKSTVAVNVANTLADKGFKVGILDVDIHGPSIAKLLGIEGKVLISNKDGDLEAIKVNENLYALTIAALLRSPDDPVIWRGPLKMKMIKQFLGDIKWPQLDFLIIDCPPGTGDEPLSSVQIVGNLDGSIIVSTPQDLSLLDARKTINFSKKLNVEILGIVENMSGFKCPHCGEMINIFEGMGVKKAAEDFGVDILGQIPIDPNISKTGDMGESYMKNHSDAESAKEFSKIADAILAKFE